MPSVGLKYVVSFTSQDDKHPVTNLISGDGYKKWLSHPQEKSMTIEAVFQLDQFCQISYLDVGSIWCANMEVQVGRSDWPAGRDFQTLVYTVSLMTPAECSAAKNTNKTQMFSSDLFCPEVAKQQWDRLKIICRQPHNKHVQFGLSFIRVKTSGSTPGGKKGTGNARETASVKTIQKHFFGKKSSALSSPQENLKSKLLKIAGTSENGAEHDGLLSRPAKLVLAASAPKPKVFSPETKSPVTENRGMYSGRMEQKYGPKLEDEAEEFFLKLKIEKSELDKILISDLRHSFERKKRRKLTKEEKKMFRDMAEKFISEKFGGDADKNEVNDKAEKKDKKDDQKIAKGVPNIVTKTFVMPKQVNNTISGNESNSSVKTKVIVNGKTENPGEINKPKVQVPERPQQPVKRKLDETEPTTPVTKLRKTDTILQKLKSPDNIKPFTERTNIEPIRKKIEIPLKSKQDSNTPRGVYTYKGIRGGESLDLTQTQDIKSDFGKTENNVGKSENVLFSTTCARSPVTEANNSILSSDDSLPDINLIGGQIEVESVNDENIESVRGRGNGSRGRRARGGRARGRGGRGRGSRGARGNNSNMDNNNTMSREEFLDDLEQMGARMAALQRLFGMQSDDLDDVSPEEPQRGRGQGRGRGRGSGGGRGRKKKEAHSTPGVADTSCRQTSSSPPRVPRGFTKCTGCNDVFGDTLIAGHYLRCSAYKAKQNPSKTSTCTTSNTLSQTSCTPTATVSTPVSTGATPLRGPFTGPDTSTPSTPRGRGRGRGRGRSSRTPRASGYTECEGCNDLFGTMMIERHRERCTPYQLMLVDSEIQPDTPPTCASTACSDQFSTPSPRRRGRGRQTGRGRGKKTSSTASLEIRPTGFAKCDGCNQYFGENLLAAHQERCPSLKKKPKPSSTSDSPWLSSRPSEPGIVSNPYRNSTPSRNGVSAPNRGSSVNNGNISDNQNTLLTPAVASNRRISDKKNASVANRGSLAFDFSDSDDENDEICKKNSKFEASYDSLCENIKASCGGNESDAEPEVDVQSPPWLLALHAAERRLEEQRLVQQCTSIIADLESGSSTSCADNDTCGSVLDQGNKSVERKAFIEAQARQLEKLKKVEETMPAECLRSGMGPSTSSCNFEDRNSKKSCNAVRSNTSCSTSNQRNLKRKRKVRNGANSSIDLTVESDDDDDDDHYNGDFNDDLDGFIVNDDDDSYDHADFYPDMSSQVFGDSDEDDDDINANGERLIGRNSLVECPLCGEYFPETIIQFHAATCYL